MIEDKIRAESKNVVGQSSDRRNSTSRLQIRTNLSLVPLGIFLFSLPFSHTVALRLLALFTAAVIAFAGWRARNTPSVPIKIPLALWAGMALLSLTWATNLSYSIGEIRNEIGYSIVAFLTFYSMAATEHQWRVINGVLTASFLAVSAVGLYWFVRGYDQVVDAPHGGVGHYSTYLITILPLLIVTCLRSSSGAFPARLIWLLIPLVLLDGYGTANRAFGPVFMVSIVVFAGLYAIRLQSSRARIRVLGTSALIVVLAATVFVETINERTSTSHSETETLEKAVRDDPRLHIWQYVIEKIEKRPFTGIGFGRGNLGPELTQRFGSHLIWHGHNVFLNYALQMGIGGVLVLVILFGALSREFWLLYRSDDATASLIGIAGITVLAGFIAKNMTDDFFVRHNALIFWSVIGMSLGYGRRRIAGLIHP